MADRPTALEPQLDPFSLPRSSVGVSSGRSSGPSQLTPPRPPGRRDAGASPLAPTLERGSQKGWSRQTIESLIASGAILGHKDGNFGSLYPRIEEFRNVGVPFLTAKLISDGKLNIKDAPRLANDRANTLKFGFVQPDDVLLSHNATIGRVAIVPYYDSPLLIGTSLTYFRLNPERLSTRYFAAYLTSADFQNQLVAVMSHSTRNQVPITAQRKLNIVVPPLPTQEAIASVLGALDDKIEQNRRTAQALERLARAIFRAWFADFEPVKAKTSGATAFPSVPQPAFDALPTRFIDSEIGPVPEGWDLLPLYETAHFINGAAFKNTHFCEPGDGLPVAKIAELKSGITDQTKYSDRTDLDPKYRIDTGDVLYSWSGSPETSLDVFLWTKGGAFLNQHIFRVVTRSEAQKHFVYYLLKHLRRELIEIAKNKQTTGLGHVTVADMRRLKVCWPAPDVFDAFEQQVGPIFRLGFALSMESESLIRIRDYLLPKLISGTVRINDAERLLEVAQ